MMISVVHLYIDILALLRVCSHIYTYIYYIVCRFYTHKMNKVKCYPVMCYDMKIISYNGPEVAYHT